MAKYGSRKRTMGDFGGPGPMGQYGGPPGPWSKMSRTDGEFTPLLKLLVPEHMCGYVLGKAGCNMKELGKAHSGRISFSVANTFFPGTEDRICLIQAGQPQRCNDIAYKIMEKMMKYDKTTVRLLATSRGAGLIIGKGGSTIKEMEAKIGIRISADASPVSPMDERIITLTGTLKKRGEAMQKIANLIADEPSNKANVNLVYGMGMNMGMGMPMPNQVAGFPPNGAGVDAEQLKEQLFSAITGYPMAPNSGGMTPLASTVELKFEVPFHMVGYIIGNKGAGIKEMTHLSNGAKFEFDDFAGPEVVNGGLRKLTVTGSLEQINLAYQLVHAKANEYMMSH